MNLGLIGLRLRHEAKRLGPIGGAGVLLFAAAIALALGNIVPAQDELLKLEHRIAKQREQVAHVKLDASTAEPGREAQLTAFYEAFPDVKQVPELLRGVYATAEKFELSLQTGEYTLARSESPQLNRYRVSLPVHGRFAKVLGFMDACLQASENITLESASFKREKVDDPQVDAKLVFTIFVKAEP